MQRNPSDRRSFIRKIALGTLAAMSIPEIASSASVAPKHKKLTLAENATILFQGDSITDASRNRTDLLPNSPKGFGSGYAFLAASELLIRNPKKNFKIYNRGISGNKVYQLAERWDTDALDLKPDIVSILIGVNDYWHLIKNNYKGTLEIYKTDYRALLNRTKEKLPDVKFIIGEPFAILGTAVDKSWFPAFDAYREAARSIANEFDAAFIPYQTIFNAALEVAPGSYWAPDGVHPSIAGAKLMADAWLNVVKAG
jgi:lysophospholipase L1-like esterase